MARTAHFFLYALPRLPIAAQAGTLHGRARLSEADTDGAPPELSTGEALVDTAGVDDLPCAVRFGLVLPKKQARRSVTRSLIRHQAREAVRRHAPALSQQPRFGRDLDAWVLRLRAPFDRQQFPSAASAALSVAVRTELDELWGHLARAQA